MIVLFTTENISLTKLSKGVHLQASVTDGLKQSGPMASGGRGRKESKPTNWTQP